MLTELLYPLQDGNTPLHLAAREGHTTCTEHLLSTPGIDVNIKNRVSWSIEMLLYIRESRCRIRNVVNMIIKIPYPIIAGMPCADSIGLLFELSWRIPNI